MNSSDLSTLIDREHMIECPDCEGTGIFHNGEGKSWTCQECDGDGEVDSREL